MTPSNILYFSAESKVSSDSERAARLWQDMEESLACWEGLARGATHNSRFDPRGSVAAVYAYGAHVMRRIKRKSVDALFLKKAAEDAVCEQILSELEKFQTECESAVQARSATRGVSYAITACLDAVGQMRLSAGCEARVDRKVTVDKTKAVMPVSPPSRKPKRKAAKRKKAAAKSKG